MATKITKSELKNMIREALREELSKHRSLKEADESKWAADGLAEKEEKENRQTLLGYMEKYVEKQKNQMEKEIAKLEAEADDDDAFDDDLFGTGASTKNSDKAYELKDDLKELDAMLALTKELVADSSFKVHSIRPIVDAIKKSGGDRKTFEKLYAKIPQNSF